GKRNAPVRDPENRVVPHERRRFLVASTIANLISPNKTETFHIRRIDLLERAEARLARRESIAQPFAVGCHLCGILQRGIVDLPGLTDQESAESEKERCRQITHSNLRGNLSKLSPMTLFKDGGCHVERRRGRPKDRRQRQKSSEAM